VRLDRIKISDYRNLASVQLAFSDVSVVVGENAQGKSNLLEAIYLLATMKAIRAETDAQVIRRGALDDVLPAARVVGQVSTAEGPVKLEVTVVARPGSNGHAGTKTVKVNGVGKRMSDAVGRMTAVLFTAEDMEMVTGPRSLRRRYIDVTLTQVDAQYSAARSRYERVLTQRNALLKRIREGIANEDELPYWDEELTKDGSLILHRRSLAIGMIADFAHEAHAVLAPGESLDVAYRPKLEAAANAEASEEDIREAYQRALTTTVSRDVAAGMTLTGPHRDDIEFTLDGLAAAGFASRAQQRTTALSLRLAEARFLRERRGEPPVLLLDDILSEMDSARRRSVLTAIGNVDQMMVTGTDWDRFPDEFLAAASRFEVRGGSVHPLGVPHASAGIAES
jgi:DNA replication and repair protein RecF